MKPISPMCALVIIGVACSPTPPDDGAQYFANIAPETSALEAEKQRLDAAERTDGAIPAAEPSQTQIDSIASTAIAGLDSVPNGQNSAAISDSQDFTAVTARETIESDAAKLAALRDQYTEVSTEEIGTVPSRTGPNLARYALQSKNAVGEKVYRRIGLGLSGCGRYRNDPDAAQRAFLARGGPERDPGRLDADGDGFACDWDPSVYRRLLAPTQSQTQG